MIHKFFKVVKRRANNKSFYAISSALSGPVLALATATVAVAAGAVAVEAAVDAAALRRPRPVRPRGAHPAEGRRGRDAAGEETPRPSPGRRREEGAETVGEIGYKPIWIWLHTVLFVLRWTERWTCFVKQPPGKARQKFKVHLCIGHHEILSRKCPLCMASD